MGNKIYAHDIREETRAPFFLISSHNYWEDKQCTIESREHAASYHDSSNNC